ncbi:MAG: hypothetical protein ACPG52_08550 [Cognaticolwellia sp.]
MNAGSQGYFTLISAPCTAVPLQLTLTSTVTIQRLELPVTLTVGAIAISAFGQSVTAKVTAGLSSEQPTKENKDIMHSKLMVRMFTATP